MSDILQSLLHDVFTRLQDSQTMLVTAESCTGGLIAKTITDIAGSSSVYERGFVTYSNTSKTELLNVSEDLLNSVGAVSDDVAKAMVKGALENSHANLAVSCTGIAGPGGGTEQKPVGLVYIGIGTKENIDVHKHIFKGNREAVRVQTLEAVLKYILDTIQTD